MIDKYRDYAANERTMLAWVRTALAITAFGFMVEKFNLVLRLSDLAIDRLASSAKAAEWVGMVFMIAGVGFLILSLFRFMRTERLIDSGDLRKATGKQTDFALFAMLAALLFTASLFLGHGVGLLS